MLKKNRAIIKLMIVAGLILSGLTAINAITDLFQYNYHLNYRKIDDSVVGESDELNKIEYFGIWDSGASDDSSNGTEHYTNKNIWGSDITVPGYTIKFKGTEISIYGNKTPLLGKSKVFIDGVEVGVFDAENSVRITQQLLFKVEDLSNTEHVLRVENMKSGGTLNGMNLDYLLVRELNESEDDSLIVSPASLTLKQGEQGTIEANLREGLQSAILWESDNPDVAEVESGLVTAKKVGITQIQIICEQTNSISVVQVQVVAE